MTSKRDDSEDALTFPELEPEGERLRQEAERHLEESGQDFTRLEDLELVGGAVLTSIRRTFGNSNSFRDVETKEGAELKMNEDHPAPESISQDEYLNKLADKMDEVADGIESSPGDRGWRDKLHFGARVNDDLAWLAGRPGILGVGAGLMLNSPKSFDFASSYSNSSLPQSETVEEVLEAGSEFLNYNLARYLQMEGLEMFGNQPFEEISPLYLCTLGIGAYAFDKGLNGANNYWKKLENFTENQGEIAQVYREAARELREENEISNGSPEEQYKDRRTPIVLGHIHRLYNAESDEWKRKDPKDRGTFGLMYKGGEKAYSRTIGNLKEIFD